MKTFVRIALVALVIASVSLSSCKKYDDGPTISLLTKKMRIDGTWTVEKYIANGTDETSQYRSYNVSSETITIDKAGTWTETGTTAVFNVAFSASGTWAFTNSKADVTWTETSSSNGGTETYHILKLKNTEFWYTYTNGNTIEEWHLKSK